MKPLFSFIVVNFQSARFLPNWFLSLQKTKLLPHEYEVIIVNNDISETKVLKKLQSQFSFQLIQNTENIGFGSACNKGSEIASGKFLGFINPDTLFNKGNMRSLVKYFKKNPSIGAIGLQLLSQKNIFQEWSAGYKTNFFDIVKNNIGFPKSKRVWTSKKILFVDWVSGAALFIPHTLFKKINGFDTDYFLYFEDMDICTRIRNIGKKVVYFPHISFRHIGGQSVKSTKQQKFFYYTAQNIFFKKHCTKLDQLLLHCFKKIFIRN